MYRYFTDLEKKVFPEDKSSSLSPCIFCTILLLCYTLTFKTATTDKLYNIQFFL